LDSWNQGLIPGCDFRLNAKVFSRLDPGLRQSLIVQQLSARLPTVKFVTHDLSVGAV
jgi:hypothetical protein